MSASLLILILIVATATTTDLLSQKISNRLVLLGLACGIALQVHAGTGLGSLALSIVVPFVILIPFYAGGGMAAGDVKLMAACGSLLGWPDAMLATGATLVVGSVLGVSVFLVRGGFEALFARYALTISALVRTGQFFLAPAEEGSIAKGRFPYALAIALGSLSAPWLSRFI